MKEKKYHNFKSRSFKEKTYNLISFIVESRLSRIKYLIFFMKNIDFTKHIKINKKIIVLLCFDIKMQPANQKKLIYLCGLQYYLGT